MQRHRHRPGPHRSPFAIATLLLALLACGMIAGEKVGAASPGRCGVDASATQAVGALSAARLRCEWTVDPIGIGELAPRLSWIVESTRRDEHQTAYRVLVASTLQRLDANEGELWDSGRLDDSATVVEYDGAPLRSGAVAHWKVMVWDRDDVAGQWSAPARWEMGLVGEGDWTAGWIDAAPMVRADARAVRVLRAIYLPVTASVDEAWASLADADSRASDVTALVAGAAERGEPIDATNAALGGDPAVDTLKRLVIDVEIDGAVARREVAENGTFTLVETSLPLLRHDFTIERPIGSIRSARLHATALGVYDVLLNGTPVGDLALAPGWTDYRVRVARQMHDVTDLIRNGDNAIGAIVAPGWFSGRAGLFHARAFYGAAPAFACQLEIQYDDGSTQRIVTDAQWRRRPGPTVSADIMDGETYDARTAIEGWCDPSTRVASEPSWSAEIATRAGHHSVLANPQTREHKMTNNHSDMSARTMSVRQKKSICLFALDIVVEVVQYHREHLASYRRRYHECP